MQGTFLGRYQTACENVHLRLGQVEGHSPGAMMASNYPNLSVEVLLLDKHPCPAQVYMLDEQGYAAMLPTCSKHSAFSITWTNSDCVGAL